MKNMDNQKHCNSASLMKNALCLGSPSFPTEEPMGKITTEGLEKTEAIYS